jgi:hypothetical protein
MLNPNAIVFLSSSVTVLTFFPIIISLDSENKREYSKIKHAEITRACCDLLTIMAACVMGKEDGAWQ